MIAVPFNSSVASHLHRHGLMSDWLRTEVCQLFGLLLCCLALDMLFLLSKFASVYEFPLCFVDCTSLYNYVSFFIHVSCLLF
jgi:hypothetical protein